MAMLATACADDAPAGENEVKIVATTAILGDVAANVAGDSATVIVLLPRGADPHDYQASSREASDIVSADLVIANGLHLEEGLLDVIESAESDGVNVLWIGEAVDPIPFGGDGQHEDLDPHVWLDPVRMAEAARVIAAELETIEPGAGWTGRAEVYAADLLAADTEIAAILADVPADDRKLVTAHNAFGYFALRYDFEVIGTVIPGGSTLAEPSSAEMSALADLLRSENVPAIFTDVAQSATLSEVLADELGGAVEVVALYTGTLGEPGSGADTLIGMLETNARRIAEALL